MSILNIFKKKQKKNNSVSDNNVSKETNVTVPILPSVGPFIGPGTLEKTKRDKEEGPLSHYINGIKKDGRLKELFPEIIDKLEEDLSEEEKRELIKPIQDYQIKEMRRRGVFNHLPYEYNKAIKRKAEENYKTGKVEEFPLCKRVFSYEELKVLYPEEIKYLEDIYLPVYEEYMDEYSPSNKKEFVFEDLTAFAEFIEKINYYEGSMISDQYFNEVNDALDFYGKEFYGDRLSGIVKYYYFKYDDYLKVKNNIMDETEILMNENSNDDEKRDAVIKIKSKGIFYLSRREGEYIV